MADSENNSLNSIDKFSSFTNNFLKVGANSGKNKFWMYFLTVLFVFIGYLGYQSVVGLYLIGKAGEVGIDYTEIRENSTIIFNPIAMQIDRNIMLLLLFGMFVFAMFGLYVGVKYLNRKKFLSIITSAPKFRTNRFAFSFFVWALMLVFSFSISLIVAPTDMVYSFNLKNFSLSFIILLVFLPIQTGLEEFFFRGYLLQGLSQWTRNGVIPIIITSLFFSLMHMSNPETIKFGWQIMFGYYFLFAAFMAIITLLDEGLELAYGIHFANNFISSILVTQPNSVLRSYSIYEAKTDDASAELVLSFSMIIVTFTLFFIKYKWKNLKLLIK
ncbi:MAG: CPBP family intramembrane metalloprotease [Bacteroidetes bacterium]|nr:CPBP family intramembrane metalloprotease [Bacteroidota bacterium]